MTRYANYLGIAKDMLRQIAGRRGYELRDWTGYYCGAGRHMTHYAAVFAK